MTKLFNSLITVYIRVLRGITQLVLNEYFAYHKAVCLWAWLLKEFTHITCR